MLYCFWSSRIIHVVHTPYISYVGPLVRRLGTREGGKEGELWVSRNSGRFAWRVQCRSPDRRASKKVGALEMLPQDSRNS